MNPLRSNIERPAFWLGLKKRFGSLEAVAKAATNSGPTSYEAWAMQGPSAATTALRLAPSRSIAATVASTIPARAPFQPACAAPTTPARLVSEQDHATISSGHAEREAGRRCDERVATRATVRRPGFRNDDGVRRMNLIRHGQAVGRAGQAQPRCERGFPSRPSASYASRSPRSGKRIRPPKRRPVA